MLYLFKDLNKYSTKSNKSLHFTICNFAIIASSKPKLHMSWEDVRFKNQSWRA